MSTSVSSVTNHFPSAENGFTTTTSGSVSSGAATVGLNSVAGYTNGETAVFVIDPSNASKQTFTGVIDTGGVQVTGVVWTAGSNTSHSAGATVVDYATATHISMMTKGILVEHKQTGAHSAITADSIVNAGALTQTGAATITGALTVKSYDGWINPTDTWTYASATTFTISGVDRTAQFPVGTKLKLTQTTAKYFYVTATSFSTNTTVTVTGGTDYSLANAAITSPALSYDATPQGFPTWFNYTPTLSGQFTDGDWTKTCKFTMSGKTINVRFSIVSTDATPMAGGAGAATFTLPVTSVSYPSATYSTIGRATINDNGTALIEGVIKWSSTTTARFEVVVSSGGAGTYIRNDTAISSTTPMTWTTSDAIDGLITYEAA